MLNLLVLLPQLLHLPLLRLLLLLLPRPILCHRLVVSFTSLPAESNSFTKVSANYSLISAYMIFVYHTYSVKSSSTRVTHKLRLSLIINEVLWAKDNGDKLSPINFSKTRRSMQVMVVEHLE